MTENKNVNVSQKKMRSWTEEQITDVRQKWDVPKIELQEQYRKSTAKVSNGSPCFYEGDNNNINKIVDD